MFAALLVLFAVPGTARDQSESLKVADGTEIDVQKLSTRGSPRVLWLPSEAGTQGGEMAVARAPRR